ncbi:hypothetical protein Pelo_8213 [Pelomyxa schiedti]|nr:hypothetical protein Pelo_8213 [Pelomyxa schiedti]
MNPQDFYSETMVEHFEMEQPRRIKAQIMRMDKPVVVVAHDGKITTFNAMAASKIACPASQVLGTSVSSWVRAGRLSYDDVYEIAREPSACTF